MYKEEEEGRCVVGNREEGIGSLEGRAVGDVVK